MSRTFPYVFLGGPLDGHEIEAVAGTAIYRDAVGNPMTATAGDRLTAGTRGLYAVEVRPLRVVQDGRVVRRNGAYRWQRPVIREEVR